MRGSSIFSEIEDRADAESDAGAAWWQAYLRGAKVGFEGNGALPLRIVDVCSGTGGLTVGAVLAANALGYSAKPLLAVDVDEQALDVYRQNLGGVTIGANIASLVDFHVCGHGAGGVFSYDPEIFDKRLADHVGDVDLFLAGPPCQGHSNLNNRTRRDDPRNLLYLAAVALAVGLKARAIIIENVPDILNDRAKTVETAKALLRSAGYSSISQKILCLDELGGAQTRRRLFLMATKNGIDDASSLISVAESLRRAPSTLEWAIGDLLDNEREGIMDSAPALSAENVRRVNYLFDNDLYDLPDLERPECHQDGTTYKSVYGRLRWDRPAQTITTGFLTPGRGRFIHPLQRRVLTPHEAARIQAFPDAFAFASGAGPAPSRLALGKWIGDAVPPLLAYAASLAAIASSRLDRNWIV